MLTHDELQALLHDLESDRVERTESTSNTGILSERRIAQMAPLDALPLPEATLSDLMTPLFTHYRAAVIPQEVIDANHRTLEEQMASLRLYDLKREAPTLAGVLLLSPTPTRFLPGAYTQFLRLSGDSLSELPLDQAEVRGDLQSALRELEARLRAQVRTRLEVVSALQERQRPDYPIAALRELVVNALMHRDYRSHTPTRVYWYEDRVEIQSPGGLYGEVTPETLMQVSSYRNPVVAECLKGLGYVNRFGYGLQRAAALLAANGNPPPRFEVDRVFRVTVWRAPSA